MQFRSPSIRSSSQTRKPNTRLSLPATRSSTARRYPHQRLSRVTRRRKEIPTQLEAQQHPAEQRKAARLSQAAGTGRRVLEQNACSTTRTVHSSAPSFCRAPVQPAHVCARGFMHPGRPPVLPLKRMGGRKRGEIVVILVLPGDIPHLEG
jgi:hypothetical protein